MFARLPEAVKQGRELVESRKRRQDSSPQLLSRSQLLKDDELALPRRASTFPESHPDTKRTAPGPSLPISQTHYASLGLDSSFNSPSPSNADFFDAVPGLTPTSSTPSLGGYSMPQRPSFPPTPLTSAFADPSGINGPLSDISTMMFPSADPLAYPNQPMTTFENKHLQLFDRRLGSPAVGAPHPASEIEMKSHPAGYAPNAAPTGPPRRHDSEAQLFGGMPMYLMQSAQPPRGFPLHSGSPSLHSIPGQGMQFDDLLNQEEWSQSFMDPGIGMPNSRTPFGGNVHFAPPGTGMGGWR
jgi:hypothetical protein